jgi:hypothetical protein
MISSFDLSVQLTPVAGMSNERSNARGDFLFIPSRLLPENDLIKSFFFQGAFGILSLSASASWFFN